MKKRVLVSMCLLGVPCRYDGASRPCAAILDHIDDCEWIPVCPEQLGGLATPRDPAERIGDKVTTEKGADVTDTYLKGAEEALKLARLFHADAALLKAYSPSCGTGTIYDGTFSHTHIPGYGVTGERLRDAGCALFNETNADQLFEYLKETNEHDTVQQ